jgi:N-acetyl-gamma-glutamyl-phosphate reductase
LEERCDAVFLGLPHKTAMQAAARFLDAGKRVIDLSADFRLREAETYEQWYGVEHEERAWLANAVYGLPEIYREEVRSAQLVANPGCYPTSAILPLAPLLRERLLKLDSIIVDSLSGVSGAGRKVHTMYLYGEVAESVSAYGLPRHRHTPEIEQELSAAAGEPVTITFTPHLLPATRGILTTIYALPCVPLSAAQLRDALAKAYLAEPFVRICPAGRLPETRHVRGSNFCDIGLEVDERTGRLILVSALDNLVKGASGQAIQNFNLMHGLPETLALATAGLAV